MEANSETFREFGKFSFGWCPIKYEDRYYFVSREGELYPNSENNLEDASPFNKYGIAF